MTELFPIHLLLGETEEHNKTYCEVLVNPYKVYNGITGEELIELYGVKPRVVKPRPTPTYRLDVSKTHRSKVSDKLNTSEETVFTFSLTKPLPKTINLKGKHFDPRALCLVIEQIQGCKLFSRRNNRLLKTSVNLSFELRGFVTEDNTLMIFGRKESIYIIRGKQ